jgi:thiol:disulfide interchange protein DsbD
MLVRILVTAVLGLGLALWCVPAFAAPSGTVAASVGVAAAAPDSTTLLWTFTLADGWHLYGPFRNDTGFAPRIDLALPDGWRAGPLRWPVPERHLTAGSILDHVYHDELLLLQTVHHPAGARAHTIAATLRWLVCKDLCVPGNATLEVAVPGPADPALAGAAAEAARSVPGPLASDRYRTERRAGRIVITAPGADALAFVPAADGPLLQDLARDGEDSGEVLTLELAPVDGADAPLRGLLFIHHTNDDPAVGWIVIP